jgi:hypothetical protein
MALDKLTVVDHPRTAGLRRAIGLILVAGLCVSAVTFYRDAELPRSAPAAASNTSSGTASTPTVGTPSASPSSATSPKPIPTAAPVKTKLPKGPGTTEPGILLMASPLRDGSFDVAEIVLLATPSSSIWLGPPRVVLAGDRFAKAKPVASQVQMSAGNQPVVVPGGRINQRTQLAPAAPTKKIELRYNLRGITIRSIPSPAGRALSVISPLVDGVPKTLPVALRISGNTVLNIGCPALRLREQACSAGRPPQLRVNKKLPWRSAVIVVQFDLPRPQ